ncbi:hypothetical protein OIU84_004883 [Salix udensis]|uniref:E3 ubiquitin-protein ligase UBR4-like domain-containing protein n=1 Tax=Salix udensis TaxID=889485 RepID=A0AAD6P4W7_9ROSI|nr:hypothetical protein OIU84_004883 [Salix udensis]
MAKPSFTFDSMENDEDMKRGWAAIELESENAHRRYQQLLGFKKPLLKIVSSIGENEMDSQQKDSVQQMMVSLARDRHCSDTHKEQGTGKSVSAAQLKDENNSSGIGSLSVFSGKKEHHILILSERRYKVSQTVKGLGQRSRSQRNEYLVLKYGLRWKRRASRTSKGGLFAFELGSWVTEFVLSACSQSIRSKMCMLINLLCARSSSRRFRLLNLSMALLQATLAAGESAAEYFELLFKMVASEDARSVLDRARMFN